MSSQVPFPRGRKITMPLLMGLILFLCPIGTASALTLADDSGALGIATMCAALLEGTARQPEQEALLQRIYQAGLQDIQSIKKLGKGGDVAEAIGIVRGAQILQTSRQPELASKLEALAKNCVADIANPKGKKSHKPF